MMSENTEARVVTLGSGRDQVPCSRRGRRIRRLSLLAVLMTIGGCPSSEQVSERLPVDAAFVGYGEPSECPARCLSTTSYYARAELGLDPTGKPECSVSETLFESLAAEAGVVGGRVSTEPLGAVLDEFRNEPMSPIVLIHENGHAHLVLGVIEIDGELLCQLAHGDHPVSLVRRDRLKAVGFREAWRFSNEGRGVPIRVGSGTLRLNKICHNFREVTPSEKLESAFAITNAGEVPVIFGKPHMSCDCTTGTPIVHTELGPGETRDFRVGYRAGTSGSQRHTVLLTALEKGTGESGQVKLELIASQRKSMKVVPTKLDFGCIAAGERCSRTVCLREVPTDRFLLKKVDPGELPVSWDVEKSRDKSGLMVYRIRLDLAVGERPAGSHNGRVTLSTSSSLRPKVVIPATFEVPQPVRAVPGAVSFGTVTIGDMSEERVRLVSQDSESLIVTAIETQGADGCSVRIDASVSPPELVIGVRATEPGVWQAVVQAKVRSPSGTEYSLDIPCAAFGRSRR